MCRECHRGGLGSCDGLLGWETYKYVVNLGGVEGLTVIEYDDFRSAGQFLDEFCLFLTVDSLDSLFVIKVICGELRRCFEELESSGIKGILICKQSRYKLADAASYRAIM